MDVTFVHSGQHPKRVMGSEEVSAWLRNRQRNIVFIDTHQRLRDNKTKDFT